MPPEENKPEKINVSARNALIGGVIAILLSPISITVAYYLGQQLDGPKLSVTNIVQQFVTRTAQDSISIPDTILTKIRASTATFNQIDADFDVSEFTKKEDKVTAQENIETLQQILDEFNGAVDIYTGDVKKLKDWNGKGEPPSLNYIPTTLLGGKTINELAKKNRDNALTVLQSLLNTLNPGINAINNFSKVVNPFIEKELESQRTGGISFKIGVLNTGKTDAVIFPDMSLNYDGKVIYFISQDYSGSAYVVVNSHSFKLINYKLNLNKGNKADMDEWSALVKNHSKEKFDVTISTSDKPIKYSTELEAK